MIQRSIVAVSSLQLGALLNRIVLPQIQTSFGPNFILRLWGVDLNVRRKRKRSGESLNSAFWCLGFGFTADEHFNTARVRSFSLIKHFAQDQPVLGIFCAEPQTAIQFIFLQEITYRSLDYIRKLL